MQVADDYIQHNVILIKLINKHANTCLAKHLCEVQLLLESKEMSNEMSSILATSGREAG